jgi:hypothetical protein
VGMSEKTYTEQELQLKILENNQSHAFKSIDRLDNSVNILSSKIDTFKYWFIGLMITQFGIILSAIITFSIVLIQVNKGKI